MNQASLTDNPSGSPDLRAKLVGILSDTANGCLTELGYFPGLLKKLQALEQSNAQWKAENVKLFRDNRTLIQLAQHQGRLKVADAAKDDPNRVVFLEEQVKSLSIQNAELKKRNGALTSGGSSSVPYQQLVSDYQQLSALYRTAVNEIEHLRQMIKMVPEFQRYHGTASQPSVLRAPDAQPKYPPVSQGLPLGHIPIRVPSNPSAAGLHVVPQHTFQEPVTSVNHDSRPGIAPMTGIPVTAYNPPLQQPLMNSTHQKVIDRPNIMTPFVPSTQPISNYRNLSLNIHTSAPLSAPREARRSPLVPQPDNQNVIPNPRSAIDQLLCEPTTARDPQSNPRPELIQPPLQTTNSHLPLSSAPNTPTADLAPYKSMSPPESVEIVTPISGIPERPSVEVASSPVLGTEQLKRVREEAGDESGVRLGSLRKKVRFEESRVTYPSEDPERGEKEGQITHPTDYKPGENSEQKNHISPIKLEEDADEESDQEIEVDSDGLRTVASCISEVMRTGAEDSEMQICRLCELRHRNGYMSEPAKPFLRATQEDLVRHLTAEHTDAWETLRRDV